jgi:hypothetical protein
VLNLFSVRAQKGQRCECGLAPAIFPYSYELLRWSTKDQRSRPATWKMKRLPPCHVEDLKLALLFTLSCGRSVSRQMQHRSRVASIQASKRNQQQTSTTTIVICVASRFPYIKTTKRSTEEYDAGWRRRATGLWGFVGLCRHPLLAATPPTPIPPTTNIINHVVLPDGTSLLSHPFQSLTLLPPSHHTSSTKYIGTCRFMFGGVWILHCHFKPPDFCPSGRYCIDSTATTSTIVMAIN